VDASWAMSGATGRSGARKRTNTKERPRSRRKFLHGTCGEPALQKFTEKICTPSLLKIGPFFGKRRLYQRDSHARGSGSRVERGSWQRGTRQILAESSTAASFHSSTVHGGTGPRMCSQRIVISLSKIGWNLVGRGGWGTTCGLQDDLRAQDDLRTSTSTE
jgi:hypothetical protein